MFNRFVVGMFLLAIVLVQGCGGADSIDPAPGAGATGMVQVSLTDAPAYGLDHVWITVRGIWFHQAGEAGPEQAGWHRFPLAAPMTLDLLELGNGAISAPVLDGVDLPVGEYEQVRVVLAGTEDALTDSARDAGLQYNNQVQVTDDPAVYPLRVPDARRGIRLEGSFEVKQNAKLKLAIDFDAGNDVVKIERDGRTEYIMKPRLASFDLENAGAIVGHIDAAAAAQCARAQFVIKAEQLSPDGSVHVVRRATFVADPATGLFVLYPLLPGRYDLVIRGIGYETVIIRNVPVIRGTTPRTRATVVPEITMIASPGPDYPASAVITSPTGAWASYYQTLPGDGEVPYHVRFRHFNPLTGTFNGFLLSSGPVRVGVYDPAGITLLEVAPLEGSGGFKAEAGAILHERSGFVNVTMASPEAAFGTLQVRFPATARTVSGMIVAPETFAPGTGLDRGVLFAVHGGMIVNAVKVDSQMTGGGGYVLENLPGGTPTLPLPRAFYSIEAFGWSSTDPALRAIAVPRFVDLRTADATGVDLSMAMLP